MVVVTIPRVELRQANGFCWLISTRRVETTLHAWFDEVLPWAFIAGRPGIDDFEVLWPRVNVWPMWAWKYGAPTDPDWLTDSRVLGAASRSGRTWGARLRRGCSAARTRGRR